MGIKLTRFDFVPEENEQIELDICPEEEKRSVIHDIVKNTNGEPVKDAVVKLLEKDGCNKCDLKPLTHQFTDECGQFLFGPLNPHKKYVVKIWYDDVKIRELNVLHKNIVQDSEILN